MAMAFTKREDGVYLLDVTGYVCPHPQIYTKKALEKIGEGDMLEVTFDNPSSAESITAMCDFNGSMIVNQTSNGSDITLDIKKG